MYVLILLHTVSIFVLLVCCFSSVQVDTVWNSRGKFDACLLKHNAVQAHEGGGGGEWN